MKFIKLGKTECNLIDPPNDGFVMDGNKTWSIRRNSDGVIALRDGNSCHPEFINGMYLNEFVQWINSKL